MTNPRRFAPTTVRFTPDQESTLHRNRCPVLPECAVLDCPKLLENECVEASDFVLIDNTQGTSLILTKLDM